MTDVWSNAPNSCTWVCFFLAYVLGWASRRHLQSYPEQAFPYGPEWAFRCNPYPYTQAELALVGAGRLPWRAIGNVPVVPEPCRPPS